MARAANQSEIARAAGVSISTVSRALSNSPGISDELRGQIQGLAKELGYRGRGALALTTRVVRTYVTAHLVNGGLVAFYSRLVESMKAGAQAAGLELELRLVQQSLDPQRILRDEAHEPTAATLLVGVDLTPELRAYFTAERPMVLVNTFDPEQRFDCVAPNNLYGARMATSQLLDAGHRQLLHLREQLRWTTLQRESGFREAVANVDGAHGEVADIRGGDEILIELARAKAAGKAGWTGVFAVHDNAAIRFIHALEDVGLRVPRDVSVIGFDDLPTAAMMTPRLTTMRVDTETIGRQAIALLLRRIAEPDACRLQVECGVVPVAGASIHKIA
jgi:DNA-binding LacI/PurR family transcriptional regulator